MLYVIPHFTVTKVRGDDNIQLSELNEVAVWLAEFLEKETFKMMDDKFSQSDSLWKSIMLQVAILRKWFNEVDTILRETLAELSIEGSK